MTIMHNNLLRESRMRFFWKQLCFLSSLLQKNCKFQSSSVEEKLHYPLLCFAVLSVNFLLYPVIQSTDRQNNFFLGCLWRLRNILCFRSFFVLVPLHMNKVTFMTDGWFCSDITVLVVINRMIFLWLITLYAHNSLINSIIV